MDRTVFGGIFETGRNQDDFRQFFEIAREGFFRIAENGRYLLLNPAMARIFGYDSPEEMIRPSRTRPGSSSSIRLREEAPGGRRKTDRPLSLETKACRKDGQIIWISLNIRCVRDEVGRIRYCEGVVTDVTNEKRWKKHGGRRGGVSPPRGKRADAVFVVQDGTIKFANRVAENVLGYTRVRSTDCRLSSSSIPTTATLSTGGISETEERGGCPHFTNSGRQPGRQGTERAEQLQPVMWKDRPGAYCFIRDITVQKSWRNACSGAKDGAIGTLAGGSRTISQSAHGHPGYASLDPAGAEEGNPLRERALGIERQVKSGADLARRSSSTRGAGNSRSD
jgi:PAS domain S-box-containing protein